LIGDEISLLDEEDIGVTLYQKEGPAQCSLRKWQREDSRKVRKYNASAAVRGRCATKAASLRGEAMSEQMLLPGIEPKPALTDRFFFAVLPAADVIGDIERCRQAISSECALRGRPVIAGRLHVSLLGLGDYPAIPQRFIASLGGAAAKVESQVFTATFDRASSFSGGARGRPLVLTGGEGTEGMISLQQRLLAELRKIGLRLKAQVHFNPHLTLLYSSTNVVERSIQPIVWTVREFVLVHSRIGGNRPYAVLGRWPLTQ
jgi:2'-5' RNA ligase